MKKVKILTSLSALALATATTPVISTSCSYDAFSFDGEYVIDEILTKDWCMKNLLNDDEIWYEPEQPDMHTGMFSDPKAINYVRDNIYSSKLYMNFIIFSLLAHFKYNMPEQCPKKVKFDNTSFIFNASTSAFKIYYEISTFNDETGEYVPYFIYRSREDKVLQILSVSQFSDDEELTRKSFVIGADYSNKTIDYGTEVKIYGNEEETWSDWLAVDITNDFTKYLIDGLSTIYIPDFILPSDVQFRGEEFSLALDDKISESTSGYNELHVEAGKNYLYSIEYLIDDIRTFSDDKIEIEFNPQTSGLVAAPGRYSLALYVSESFAANVTMNLHVTFSSYGNKPQIFSYAVMPSNGGTI
ncbi:MAG: hypothetical protein HUJ52_00815 [Malacoplasma sp.]|nr:hypothetical protein [Malacoplasma sp.]